MSRDLPARADLEHLKQQAKDLLRDARAGRAEALDRFRAVASTRDAGRDAARGRTPGRTRARGTDRPAPRSAPERGPSLARAQHVIAREYGFASWAKLRAHVAAGGRDADPFAALAQAVDAGDTESAATLLRAHVELRAVLDAPSPGGAFGGTLLLRAVSREDREMIDLLLRHGADVDARSHWWAGSFGVLDGCTSELAAFLIDRGATVDVHAAARLGMFDVLARLVAARPELVHARGGDGKMPLHWARTVEIAAYLLDHGADIDALDVDHESTAAQYLVRERPEVARFLVERGGRTDILMATALGDLERVRRFVEEDPAVVHTRVSARWFPMRNERAGGTIYIWTLGQNATAHALAREFGHAAVLELLLEHTPDALQFAYACEAGDERAVRALLGRHPALARSLPDDARGALVGAAWRGDEAAVRLMLGAGWPVDARDEHGRTALHAAAWRGDAPLVRELLRSGASVDAVENMHHQTPIGWALHGSLHSDRRGDAEYGDIVDALVGAGAAPPPLTADLQASDAVRTALRRQTARRRSR